MASYKNTNPEAVEIAMGITGIKHHDLIRALLERGHSADEIKTMSAAKRLDEYLSWEGIIGWTGKLLSASKAAGFISGTRDLLDTEKDGQIDSYLEGVVGVVEADDYGQHMLWTEYAEEARRHSPGDTRSRFEWESTGHGYMPVIGYIGDMPVTLSLMTVTVKGHKLLFYYSPSTIVDHGMIREWFLKNLPASCRFGPGGFNHTNAMNFTNVFPREPV